MILIVSLPGVATADVRYKWLTAGTLGAAQSTGVTQVGTWGMFRIDSTPPANAEELFAYDVNDDSNFALGKYSQLKVDVAKINGTVVIGTGVIADKWRA